jgi:hypothetical protein
MLSLSQLVCVVFVFNDYAKHKLPIEKRLISLEKKMSRCTQDTVLLHDRMAALEKEVRVLMKQNQDRQQQLQTETLQSCARRQPRNPSLGRVTTATHLEDRYSNRLSPREVSLRLETSKLTTFACRSEQHYEKSHTITSLQ